MNLNLCEGTFEVVTKGYFNFKTGISLAPNAYNYTRVGEQEVPVREYHLGRVAILTIEMEGQLRQNGSTECDCYFIDLAE